MTAPIGLGDGGTFCGYVSGYKNEDETALYFDAIAANEDRLRLEVVIGNQGFDDLHKIRLGRYLQSDGSWSAVCDIATATSPQENDMLLENGFTALQPCTWRKNQFGEVNLGGCVSGNISDGVLVATMPVGCRPNRIVERPATFQSLDSGYTRYAGSVMISPDGNVVFHITGTANYGNFSADYATS